jgi:hypothetical protein
MQKTIKCCLQLRLNNFILLQHFKSDANVSFSPFADHLKEQFGSDLRAGHITYFAMPGSASYDAALSLRSAIASSIWMQLQEGDLEARRRLLTRSVYSAINSLMQ